MLTTDVGAPVNVMWPKSRSALLMKRPILDQRVYGAYDPRRGRMEGMEISPAARGILKYLLSNADAADTIEGLAPWRLLPEHPRGSFQETLEALNRLVSLGVVVEEQRPSGDKLYRLNRDNRVKAERLIRPYRR